MNYKLPAQVRAEILREVEFHSGEEICGFIYAETYVPLTNRSREPRTSFVADPGELARALNRYGEPDAIFHLHPNGGLAPSQRDLQEHYYSNSRMLIGTIENGELAVLDALSGTGR